MIVVRNVPISDIMDLPAFGRTTELLPMETKDRKVTGIAFTVGMRL
jgi:hypothetical protein